MNQSEQGIFVMDVSVTILRASALARRNRVVGSVRWFFVRELEPDYEKQTIPFLAETVIRTDLVSYEWILTVNWSKR
jgi:hypothetical protein